ncbi:hypothetical protein P3G55_20900 [Leptospira sp. 96542]|nr:hypothetical protein [Leptospira sp. 96542]
MNHINHRRGQPLGPATKAALRLLHTEGPMTRATLTARLLCSGQPITAAQIGSAINSLSARGSVDIDRRTVPGLLQITRLGRTRLEGETSDDGTSAASARASVMSAPPYTPEKYEAPRRPGAMDAYALPSRMGDSLYHLPLHCGNAVQPQHTEQA